MSRRLIIAGVSRGALAALLAAQPLAVAPALAQGFQGTPEVVFGAASVQSLGNRDTINVQTPQAIINWTPFDGQSGGGPIDFLPAGNRVDFLQLQDVAGGFTVLNRILAADPTRAIRLDGLVNSSASGRLWFYAPGGLLIGNNAVFNIGSLLLTANDPVIGQNGGFLGPGGSFSLAAATGSTAGVTIAAGAVINALQASSSYVIAVAPRIEHRGRIAVDGSAALVAAEVVDLKLNAGLFDITVTAGTTATGTDAFQSSGAITGPPAKVGLNNRIHMVAVPKNDAITMMIDAGLGLGFAVAGAADVEGNSIVLSAGHDVSGTIAAPIAADPVSTAAAGFRLERGAVTSALQARASDALVVASDASMILYGDVALVAGRRVDIGVSGGANALLEFRGSLSASAARRGRASGESATGGTILLTATSQSTVRVLGETLLDVEGRGANGINAAGGDGTGGTIELAGPVGNLQLAGTTLRAEGIGGNVIGSAAATATGGRGTGGEVRIGVATEGSFQFGTLTASATGTGGGNAGGLGAAGSGAGGAVVVTAVGNSLIQSSGFTADARGIGGGSNGQVNPGGAATGGIVEVQINDSRLRLTGDSRFMADAEAVAGAAAVAGSVLVDLQAFAQDINADLVLGDSSLTLSATARGGDGAFFANGGSALGGAATLRLGNAARVLGADNVAGLQLLADARAGSGAEGGVATGGRAELAAGDFTQIDAPNLELFLSAQAAGGAANDSIDTAAGGNAIGGTARIALTGGGDTSVVSVRTLDVDVGAVGGAGQGAGGNGSGGSFDLALDRAQLSAISLAMRADGTGGTGVPGGSGTGGTLVATITNSDLSLTGGVVASAQGFGGGGRFRGDNDGASGGLGRGGLFDWTLASSGTREAAMMAVSLSLDAGGTGGAGAGGGIAASVGGAGGAAIGGTSQLLVRGPASSLAVGNAALRALGVGGAGGSGGDGQPSNGNGGAGGAGGAATGGIATFGIGDGAGGAAITTQASFQTLIAVDAAATGGSGGIGGPGISNGAGGAGGAAAGGSATLLAAGARLTSDRALVSAGAQGGNAGGAANPVPAGDAGGGNAVGGTARLVATSHAIAGTPATIVLGTTRVDGNGTGGNSAVRAGDGSGGGAELAVGASAAVGAVAAADRGSVTVNADLVLVSRGLGGTATAAGGIAGDGRGGTSLLTLDGGRIAATGPARIDATGTGGSNSVQAGSASQGVGSGGSATLAVRRDPQGPAVIPATFNFGGSLTVAAAGRGRLATGGGVAIDFGGGSLAVAGATLFNADALGIAATGGDVRLDDGGVAGSAGFSRDFEMRASAATEGGIGGRADGGSLAITLAAGSLLSIGAADYSSFITLSATAGTIVGAVAGGDARGGSIALASAGDLTLRSALTDGAVILGVAARGGDNASGLGTGGDATGGTAQVTLTGGSFTVRGANGPGSLSLQANGTGGSTNGFGGDGRGGTAAIDIGGTALVLAGIDASALGQGGGPVAAPFGTASGDGQGGEISLRLRDGNFSPTRDLVLDAAGIGNTATGGSVLLALTGNAALQGGSASLTATAVSRGNGAASLATGGATAIEVGAGARLSLSGPLRLDSAANAGPVSQAAGGSARGGSAGLTSQGTLLLSAIDVFVDAVSADDSDNPGGAALAGNATLLLDGGTAQLGDVRMVADASSGATLAQPAAATGGTADLTLRGGAIVTATSLDFASGAKAGGGAAAGGAAQGGIAALRVDGTGTQLQIAEYLRADASARGGFGGTAGGAAIGGNATLAVSAGGRVRLAAGELLLTANARGGTGAGDGASGGAGRGGVVFAGTIGAASLDAAAATLRLETGALGGIGNGGDGGAATGGDVFAGLEAAAPLSEARFGAAVLIADAAGGDGGNGGNGRGGSVSLGSSASDGTLATASVSVDARGTGGSVAGNPGNSSGGSGGSGTGGSIEIGSDDRTAGSSDGKFDFGDLELLARGIGGAGGSGGAAAGGNITAGAVGGVVTWAAITADAAATGGLGTVGGGGGATGGRVSLGASRNAAGGSIGRLVSGSVLLAAGGDGGAGITAGGNGDGGVLGVGADVGSVAITGTAQIGAAGRGGDSAGSASGIGSGGFAAWGAAAGGSATLSGDLGIDADGIGGGAGANAGDNGGSGRGGTAQLVAGGGNLDFGGALTLSAGGTGGNGNIGGDGFAGTAVLQAAGGDIVLAGGLAIRALAFGGGNGSTGGAATGGLVAIDVTTGRLSATGVIADASGNGAPGNSGGAATGGSASVRIAADADLRTTAGGLLVRADAISGVGAGAEGGRVLAALDSNAAIAGNVLFSAVARSGGQAVAPAVANGGTAELTLGGVLTVTNGGLQVDAGATGGSGGGQGVGDAARGGLVALVSRDGGGLRLAGNLGITVGGTGGTGGGAGGAGGAGRGGTITATLTGSGGVEVTGGVTLGASGLGGSSLSAGGIGAGGSIRLIQSAGTAVFGLGFAADAGGGGGSASGGDIAVDLVSGTEFTVTSGTFQLAADANGNGLAGGGSVALISLGSFAAGGGARLAASAGGSSATGGFVSATFGGTAAFAGQLDIIAEGVGVGSMAAGNGGTATLATVDGTLRTLAGVRISANGLGANGVAGGAGSGGTAGLTIAADGNHLAGAVVVSAVGRGGAGTTSAGVGRGGTARVSLAGGSTARAAADFTSLSILADAVGGSGATDSGNATGGTAALELADADLAVAGATRLDAAARAGTGSAIGGDARLVVAAASTAGATGSSLTLTSLDLDATARGGSGSRLAGGAASGGNATAELRADMQMTAGAVTLLAGAVAGDGGLAGVAPGLAGGAARGGTARLRMAGTALAGAGATLASLDLDVSADAGNGSNGVGAGGSGGSTTGGDAGALVAGGRLAVTGLTILRADAIAGFAGTGGALVDGVARGGSVGLAVTAAPLAGGVSEFNGGVARLDSLVGQGGAAPEGPYRGNASLVADGGALRLQSAALTVGGPALDSGSGAAAPTRLRVNQGSIAVTGDLVIDAAGEVTLDLASGTLAIGDTLAVRAGGALAPGAALPAGTIDAGAIALSAGGSLTVTAALDSASDVTVAAGGAVVLGDILSVAPLLIDTPGALTVGAITGSDSVRLAAGAALRTGAIQAIGDVDLRGGGILAGNIGAGGSLRLVARPAINVLAPTALLAGNLLAGGEIYAEAPGSVGIGSARAATTIGLVAEAGTITAGALDAGGTVALLAAQGVGAGPIAAPNDATVFIGAASDAGLIVTGAGATDYAALLAARPKPVAGGVGLGGVRAGRLDVAATGAVTSGGAVTVAESVRIRAGTVALAALATGGSIDIATQSDLRLGDLSAPGDIVLSAADTIELGAVTGGAAVSISAGSDGSGNLATGDITATTALALAAAGNVGVGALSAGTDLVINAAAPAGGGAVRVAAGNVRAGLGGGGGLFVQSAGSLDLGQVAAAGAIDLRADGGGLVAARLAGADVSVRASGDIAIAGPVAGQAVALAGSNVRLGDVGATAGIGIDAIGTLQTGALVAGGDVILAAAAPAGGGAVQVTTGNITAGAARIARVRSVGGMALGAVQATGGIDLAADGGLTAAALAGGDLSVIARGDLVIAGAVAGRTVELSGASLQTGEIRARNGMALLASGNVTTGALLADREIRIDTTAAAVGVVVQVTTGDILAGNDGPGAVEIRSAGGIVAGSVRSRDTIGLYANGGALTAARLDGGDIVARSSGVVTIGPIVGEAVDVAGAGLLIGDVVAADAVALASTGNVQAGALSAGSGIRIDAIAGGRGGSAQVVTGDITAGIAGAGGIAIRSAGGLALGSVQARDAIGLDADSGDLTAARIGGAAVAARASGTMVVAGPIAGTSVDLAATRLTLGAVSATARLDITTVSGLAAGALSAGSHLRVIAATPAGRDPATITLADLTAGGEAYVQASGKLSVGAVRATGAIGLFAEGGDLAAGSLAGGDIAVAASGNVTIAGPIAGAAVDVAGTALALGDITAAAGSRLRALGGIVVGDIAAAGALAVSAGSDGSGALVAGRLRGSDVALASAGDLAATRVSAGNNIAISAAAATGGGLPTITIGALDAGLVAPVPGGAGSLFVTTAGNVQLGSIGAAGSVGIVAEGGSLTTGAITAGGPVVLLDGLGVVTGGIIAPGERVLIASHLMAPLIGRNGDGSPDYAALLAATPRALAGAVTIGGDVDAGRLVAAATGDLAITGRTRADIVDLSGGALGTGDVDAAIDVILSAAGPLSLGTLTSAGDIRISTIGALLAGDLRAGDSVRLTSVADGQGVSSVTVGRIEAGGAGRLDGGSFGVGIEATGAVSAGTITADGAVALVGGSIGAGDISAGTGIALLARTGVRAGALTTGVSAPLLIADAAMAGLIGRDAAGGPDLAGVAGAAPVRLAGDVSFAGASAGRVRVAATGTITSSRIIRSRSGLRIDGGSLALGAVRSGPIAGLAASARVLAPIADGEALVLRSDGAITAGDVRGDFDVWIDAGTSVSAGTVSAGDGLAITAGGAIATGAIDAAILRPIEGAVGQIGIEGASIAVGTVTARGNVGLFATGATSASDIATQGSVAVLAGAGGSFGAIASGAAGSVVLAGNNGDTILQSLDPLGSAAGYSFAPLLTGAPLRSGGALAVTGTIATGNLVAATSGELRLARVNAGTGVRLDSGGMLRLQGSVTTPRFEAVSLDIDIGTETTITASGRLSLQAEARATAMRIGTFETPANGGWTLDNAEIARLVAPEIFLLAPAVSAPPVVEIGSLSLAGVASGRSWTVSSAGVLRVTGAVTMANGTAADRLALTGSRVEVVTDAGGRIALVDDAGAGPGLAVTAGDIWVGDAALLGDLAQNVGFTGRDDRLGAAAATPGTAGALGAGTLTLTARRSLFIQNSGSAVLRAGFTAGSGGLRVTAGGDSALAMVINGRLIGSGGIVTNEAVREAVTLAGSAGFDAASSVNGCLLTATLCTAIIPTEDSEDRIFNIGVNLGDIGRGPRRDGRQGDPPGPGGDDTRPPPDPVREAAESLPEPRLARLVDLGTAEFEADVTEPVSAGGNPALWQDTPVPPPASPPAPPPSPAGGTRP